MNDRLNFRYFAARQDAYMAASLANCRRNKLGVTNFHQPILVDSQGRVFPSSEFRTNMGDWTELKGFDVRLPVVMR